MAAERTSMGRRLLRLALMAALLNGCAGYQAHREGLALMAQDRAEEGLASLAQASAAAPGNLTYRADLQRHREQTASRLLAAAHRARVAGQPAAARALYERLLAIEPGNSRATLGLAQLAMDERHASALDSAAELLQKGQTEAARAALRHVLLENPQHGPALGLQRRIDEQATKEALAEPSLRLKFGKPVTLQFRDANLKLVFEALSRTSGLNVLLDRDVRQDLKTSIFVKDVSVEDAINLILLQNQLEKKVLSDNTVFIYPATAAKLKDYQDLKIRSFHLTHADPKQILTMLKTLLKTKDIFLHEKTNSIVMRDTPDAIRLAEKMVADQDIADPEVMLEVEVLEISSSRLSELGIKWPSSLSLATPSTATTLGQFRDLASGDLLVTPLSGTLNLRLEDGDTNVLASPRIRVRNREKAKIMIGSRVPVITNAVTPVSTGTPVITGSVQYLDVGLKLDVEPDIHHDREVVIKVALDVSSIIKEVPNAQSGTLAYEVGTRNASTVLRLKDGETQVLAGLINDEDRRSASKVPGLGQLPLFGRLFASHKANGAKSEIVLSITPRIVGSARLPEVGELEYWAGTEASLRSGPLYAKSLGQVALSGSGAAAPQRAPAAARAAVAPGTLAPAAGSPLLLSWQGPAQVRPGERISLSLAARSTPALASLGVQIGFDPAVFKLVELQPGEGLALPDPAAAPGQPPPQAGGQIDLALSAREGAAAGPGSLVTLVFEALTAAPHAEIVVSRLTPLGPAGEALAATPPAPHVIEVAP